MENRDIAQKIVRGNYINLNHQSTFHPQSFIYKKTNEQLYEFFDLLLNKDTILSVIGSGDQILNALLTKPSKVDAFDISVFPQYFLRLKIGAIKSISREDYIRFFFSPTKTNLDEYYDDLYFEQIKNELDKETENFWTYLFQFNDWYEIYNSILFSSENVVEQEALKQNKYLEETNYYQLRENLRKANIHYIESNLLDLSIEESYDLIYLSNIIEYVKKSDYLKKIGELSQKSKGIIISYIFGELDKAMNLFGDDFSYRKFSGGSGIMITKGKVKR